MEDSSENDFEGNNAGTEKTEVLSDEYKSDKMGFAHVEVKCEGTLNSTGVSLGDMKLEDDKKYCKFEAEDNEICVDDLLEVGIYINDSSDEEDESPEIIKLDTGGHHSNDDDDDLISVEITEVINGEIQHFRYKVRAGSDGHASNDNSSHTQSVSRTEGVPIKPRGSRRKQQLTQFLEDSPPPSSNNSTVGDVEVLAVLNPSPKENTFDVHQQKKNVVEKPKGVCNKQEEDGPCPDASAKSWEGARKKTKETDRKSTLKQNDPLSVQANKRRKNTSHPVANVPADPLDVSSCPSPAGEIINSTHSVVPSRKSVRKERDPLAIPRASKRKSIDRPRKNTSHPVANVPADALDVSSCPSRAGEIINSTHSVIPSRKSVRKERDPLAIPRANKKKSNDHHNGGDTPSDPLDISSYPSQTTGEAHGNISSRHSTLSAKKSTWKERDPLAIRASKKRSNSRRVVAETPADPLDISSKNALARTTSLDETDCTNEDIDTQISSAKSGSADTLDTSLCSPVNGSDVSSWKIPLLGQMKDTESSVNDSGCQSISSLNDSTHSFISQSDKATADSGNKLDNRNDSGAISDRSDNNDDDDDGYVDDDSVNFTLPRHHRVKLNDAPTSSLGEVIEELVPGKLVTSALRQASRVRRKYQIGKPNKAKSLPQKDRPPAVRKEKKAHICNICSRTFTRRTSLNNHLNTHNPLRQKPYTCNICGKSISCLSYLKTHQESHANPWKCDLCGKNFKFKSYLTVHMRHHFNDRPYMCDLCGKAFTAGTCLKKHIRIHTGISPYQCEICQKSFAQKVCLDIHMANHTGFKPYLCEVCGKSYPLSSYLLKHRRTEHQVDGSAPEKRRKRLSSLTQDDESVKTKKTKDRKPKKMVRSLKRAVRCKLCQIPFTDRMLMHNHMREYHDV